MKPADRLNILERGLTLHRAARFADALPLYCEVLAAVPDDPDALNLAADACFSLRDFTAAAGYLEKLAAGDLRDAQYRFNLGVAYQQAGNAVDAARAFQAALDIDPLYPKGWFNLGVALENSGRVDAAATAYENAMEADAGDAAAIANLAGALAKMRAFNRALAIYDSAIQRWPREPKIRLMQAAAFREIEVYDRAAEACRVAVSLDPENADTHAALGLTLALAGMHAESVAANRLALERDSGRIASKTILAGSLIELGEFDEALALSDAVIVIDGRNVSALRNKGNALTGVARYGEAIDVFRAALAVAPEDANLLAVCADALTLAGGRLKSSVCSRPPSQPGRFRRSPMPRLRGGISKRDRPVRPLRSRRRARRGFPPIPHCWRRRRLRPRRRATLEYRRFCSISTVCCRGSMSRRRPDGNPLRRSMRRWPIIRWNPLIRFSPEFPTGSASISGRSISSRQAIRCRIFIQRRGSAEYITRNCRR